MPSQITLTRGLIAIVDPEDYERLVVFNWQALRGRKAGIFYATRQSGGRKDQHTILMHREIMRATPRQLVDHKNAQETLDNRKQNLRLATYAQNGVNRGVNSNNTSGFKGVYWSEQNQKWRAGIRISGRIAFLGLFVEKELAARAYDFAAQNTFGAFAYLNFPSEVVA